MSPPLVMLSPDGAGLRGKSQRARGSDQDVNAFLGVPYAQPPIGKLRFRPPQELKLWSGIRDATNYGPACPQSLDRVQASYGHLPNMPTEYSEDCLYLNVWTPCCTNPGQRLPVLVWIHGGAFVQGFSNIYDGTSLAAHENVVVVSVNYRLGVFGFLRSGSGTHDYQGNQGLLDQLEALKWVQKYIRYFGGDPDNVTFFGESAGAISVSVLTLSPLSKQLFHRAIVQSGSSMASNVVWSKEGGEKYFRKRLHAMGFQGESASELTIFLDARTTGELMAGFTDWYVPVVLDGEVLQHQPLVCYNKGLTQPVDCIIGFNSSEGLGFVPPDCNNSEVAKKVVEQFVSKNFFRGQHPRVIEKVTELAIAQYVTGPKTRNNFKESVSDMYGDLNFVAPSIHQAQLHSNRGRTYVYQFDHRPFYSQRPDWARADHGDEIAYVFGFPFLQYIPDIWPEEEKILSKRIMKLWANFARTGNPNLTEGPLWNQYSPDSHLYLTIGQTPTQSKNLRDLIPDRVKLWNTTVPQVIQSYSKAKY